MKNELFADIAAICHHEKRKDFNLLTEINKDLL